MSGHEQTVRIVRDGALVTVVLSRPGHRNGITAQMMSELHAALRLLAQDPGVRVLVLRGDGADFCPGADVKHYASAGPARTPSTPQQQFEVAVLLHEMPAVTIAAIAGASGGQAVARRRNSAVTATSARMRSSRSFASASSPHSSI